jgi:cytochrome P450
VFKAAQGFWLLSRYEDVAFSLRDRRFGKDFAGNITAATARTAWTSR